MRRVLAWAGVAAAIAAALTIGLQPSGDGGTPAARADRIAADLRCPVCQGLSVKDSDSPAARDIRDDIARRLAAGQSSGEIRQAYVDRYGEWILLRPGTSGFDALVWAIPAAAVAAAAVALAGTFWRWRRRAIIRPPTDEERHLVASAQRGMT